MSGVHFPVLLLPMEHLHQHHRQLLARMCKLTNGDAGVIGRQRQRGHAQFVHLRLLGLLGGRCVVVFELDLLVHFL